MNTRKQYSLFIRRLEDLPDWKLTAVTTAIAEISWPNFALFSELVEFGDTDECRHCLNMLWDNIAGQQSAKNFERLLERLEPNVPDLDELDMFGAQLAHDAIISIICAVNCAMESDIEEAASALTLSLSTIGKFIKHSEALELNGTELQQYIEEHEMYLQQLDFIDEVFDSINKAKQNPDAMKRLKAIAKNNGISHIGIGLD